MERLCIWCSTRIATIKSEKYCFALCSRECLIEYEGHRENPEWKKLWYLDRSLQRDAFFERLRFGESQDLICLLEEMSHNSERIGKIYGGESLSLWLNKRRDILMSLLRRRIDNTFNEEEEEEERLLVEHEKILKSLDLPKKKFSIYHKVFLSEMIAIVIQDMDWKLISPLVDTALSDIVNYALLVKKEEYRVRMIHRQSGRK
jgi:hypothetical protein